MPPRAACPWPEASGVLLDILRSTQHPLLNCHACLFSPCSYPFPPLPVVFFFSGPTFGRWERK